MKATASRNILSKQHDSHCIKKHLHYTPFGLGALAILVAGHLVMSSASRNELRFPKYHDTVTLLYRCVQTFESASRARIKD
jgi:hypothetical protein